MRYVHSVSCLVVLASFLVAGSGCGTAERRTSAAPRNVILLVGDGMGFEHVRAGSLYAHGREGALFMQSLPYQADVVTASVPPGNLQPGRVHVTDSAAAGTALATGHKVYNGVISLALPGDGEPYPTALENFAAQGKRTGIVSTAYITDATPAAFGAHTTKRSNGEQIVDCYLKTVRPDVILGGGYANKRTEFVLSCEMVEAAGYRAVTNREQLEAARRDGAERVFGIFGETNMPCEADKVAAATQPDKAHLRDMPSLSEMATAALDMVSRDPDGFFLLIEGGLIDKTAHGNDLARCAPEVVEFDNAVKVAVEWARKHKDTLVIVTADHETGGLQVVRGRGKGQLPEVVWSGKGHTPANVPFFAYGPGAEKVKGTLDNTDVFRLMMGTFDTSSARPVPQVVAAETQPKPEAAAAQ